jgi:hypothetical protein
MMVVAKQGLWPLVGLVCDHEGRSLMNETGLRTMAYGGTHETSQEAKKLERKESGYGQ